ncbi:MAG: LacI family DNA-binding transcriptional regulator, partial [Clostridia bacterium]|nr:LacI family DNA-binding transcriptional regulator [Clostridia bacterium]
MNIKTLAKLCGVSVSTVSRAINGHPDVNEEVRQRILQTARDFHYIPNDAARDLVSRRSDAVGLVVKGIGNLFYTPVIRAIENATEDEGFTFVLHQINTDEDELQAGETLARSKNLRGLIFLGGRCDYTSAQTALLTVPFVCCTYRNSFGTL